MGPTAPSGASHSAGLRERSPRSNGGHSDAPPQDRLPRQKPALEPGALIHVSTDVHNLKIAPSDARPSTRPPSCRLNTHSDRKSTRLNSSHLVISYAVFCLKKKKK